MAEIRFPVDRLQNFIRAALAAQGVPHEHARTAAQRMIESDLRGMGAGNATRNRLLHATRRQVLLEAARLYQEKFSNAEGCVPATFQVIYAIGWAPVSETRNQKISSL